MKRAALYARVSGEDRSKDNRNLEGQIEAGRAYARERGYQVVAEFQEDDRGASGADWDLPQIGAALDLAQAGKIDVLIVRELSRFARNLVKQLVVEKQFKDAGVKVEYINAQYEDTPEGVLNKNIQASIAEYERELIKARMTRGRRQKVARCEPMIHTRPPFGYRVEAVNGKQTLVVVPEEAEAVRLIYGLFLDDKLPLRQIAKRLAELGVLSSGDKRAHIVKKRERGEWSPSTVSRILKNETYAGIWRYGKYKHAKNEKTGKKTLSVKNPSDYVITLEVTPIIERERFQAAQVLLERNKAFAARNRKGDYLLSGMGTCGKCGKKVYVSGSKRKGGGGVYYRCSVARKMIKGGACCDASNFRMDVVDRAVWDWVKTRLLDEENLKAELESQQQEQARRVAPFRERLAIIDGLLVDNQRQLERLLDLYLESDSMTKDILTDRKQRIEKTIEALEDERAKLAATIEAEFLTQEQAQTILELGREIAATYPEADEDFETKRAILKRLKLQAVFGENKDGEQTVFVYCLIGQDTINYTIVSNTSRSIHPS